MGESSKLVFSTCIGLATASVSGIIYSVYTSKKEDLNEFGLDSELTVKTSQKKCSCPFANIIGVSVTGGIVGGALSWVYYPLTK